MPRAIVFSSDDATEPGPDRRVEDEGGPRGQRHPDLHPSVHNLAPSNSLGEHEDH